jgi:integrase
MVEKILLNPKKSKLGAKRLKTISRRDVEALHGKLKDTPYQANRVLALLSTIFNYAIEEERLTENPVRGIERYPEQKREHYLNKDDPQEIARFTEALDNYRDQTAANALRLLLLTGSRLSEVLKADWSQFDLTRGVWTKPSHHTKQKKPEHVPLSAPARDLLEGMNPSRSKAHVPLFPGVDGKKARVSIKRPWLQALKAAGLVEVVEVPGKRKGPDGKPRMLKEYKPKVRIHDLRHTFASHLASSGVSLQIIGGLIGHTQASTTQRYAHLQDESLRTATEQFGQLIAFPNRKRA